MSRHRTKSPAAISGMNDAQMAEALRNRPVLILPLGAVESHGDHLPAGTDNILADRLAEALVRRVAGTTPVLLMPVLPFGQVWSLADAPGTFGISHATVVRTLVELARAARAKGMNVMAIVNAHMGNAIAVRDAQRLAKDEGFTIAHLFYPGADEVVEQVRERPRAHPAYMHACEIETSYALHLAPEIVDMDKAVENYPDFPGDFGSVAYRWTEFTDSPVLGDARAATAEKGGKIIEAVLANMEKQVADLYARQFK